MPRKHAPFMVAASGCAPPMPPSPPDTTSLSVQRSAEMLARRRRERLVGALHDSLGADVDPRAGRHLAVHRQAELLRAVEFGPSSTSCPPGWQLAIRTRGAYSCVRKTPTGLPDCTSRVSSFSSACSDAHDRVEACPVPRGPSRAAVDDQIVGAFGDLGVEIVHQHPERRFLMPSFAASVGPPRRPHGNMGRHGELVPLSSSTLPLNGRWRRIFLRSPPAARRRNWRVRIALARRTVQNMPDLRLQ